MIVRAANRMLLRFGDDSLNQTCIRAGELAFRGELEGAELWWQIEAELQSRSTLQIQGIHDGQFVSNPKP